MNQSSTATVKKPRKPRPKKSKSRPGASGDHRGPTGGPKNGQNRGQKIDRPGPTPKFDKSFKNH